MGQDRKKGLRLLNLFPRSQNSWFILALIFALLGATFWPSSLSAEQTVKEKIVLVLRAGNYPEAISLCLNYLKEHPEDLEISFFLAQAYAFSGKYQEAQNTLNQILAVSPHNQEALLLRGKIFLWEKNYQAAETDFISLLQLDPENKEGLLGLARLKEITGKVGEAERIYLKLQEANPEDAEINFRLGLFYAGQGNRERALKFLALASRLQPENTTYHDFLNKIKLSRPPKYELWFQYRIDDYSHQPEAFPSQRIYFLYRPSANLTLIPKLAHTKYFQRTDYQLGMELYPRLGKRTYVYFDLNYSPQANYLPRTSFLLETYLKILSSLEGSIGFWPMHFKEKNVYVYLGSINFYFRTYLALLRLFYTPEERGTSTSWIIQGRKYLTTESYLYLTYGRGSRPFLIANLQDLFFIKSQMFGAGVNLYLFSTWKIEGHFSLVKEENGTKRNTFFLTAGYRF